MTRSRPRPVVGEIRALNGLSWTPWVLITRVQRADDGHLLARFAVLDDMDDDVLTPVPDRFTVGIEATIGDRHGRRELAKVIDEDDAIDKRWCPVGRLDVLGTPGIQGCPPTDPAHGAPREGRA